MNLKEKLENKGNGVVFLQFDNIEESSNEHVIDKIEVVSYDLTSNKT